MIYLDFGNIGKDDIELVSKYMEKGLVSSATEQVNIFEQEMAAFLGVRSAIAVNSGTSALHLALVVAGVGPGDDVIVPALTFKATENAVRYTGANPILCDVNDLTWLMDVDSIERVITENTKAIIPVHLYGNVCDISKIRKAFPGKIIIEDAAEALGSRIDGYHAGTLGDFGCFSFNGNKTMTTGGGGLIVCNPSQYDSLFHLATQAKDNPQLSGFNYRMTGLSAALGLSQLKKLKRFVKIKNHINETYKDELKKHSNNTSFQMTNENVDPCWWFTSIRLNSIDSGSLELYLSEKGIPYRKVFQPLDCDEWSKKDAHSSLKAANIYSDSLCLPSSTLNTTEGIKEVCRVIKKFLKTK